MAEKEHKEEKESKQLFSITTNNVWKITTVVLAVLVIILIILITRDFMSPAGGPSDATDFADDTEDDAAEIEFSDVELSDGDWIKGEEDAPVTIIEYSDFQCPYCQRFYLQTLSSIEENYIDTGKVKIVFRHFPLSFHQNAQISAEAAECAGEQGMFWEMHDMLFENGSGDGTGLAQTDIEGYAADLGLDTATFSECLDSGKYTEKVQTDIKTGAAQGVKGTPGFIVNGVLVSGAQPYSVFEQVIEAALAAE
ncbi:hypothetical protein COV16_04415 [Candidatus Woesearchaeota archaeon CG10_big_fil_rev_8_21_14_0_10_34_8]|nr:MAG: hypothetical protein COV16_04415 [Candidatus Woesearchaeota archaeon CG10_big_fil_rev_8_21_14_0_10_34_8]